MTRDVFPCTAVLPGATPARATSSSRSRMSQSATRPARSPSSSVGEMSSASSAWTARSPSRTASAAARPLGELDRDASAVVRIGVASQVATEDKLVDQLARGCLDTPSCRISWTASTPYAAMPPRTKGPLGGCHRTSQRPAERRPRGRTPLARRAEGRGWVPRRPGRRGVYWTSADPRASRNWSSILTVKGIAHVRTHAQPSPSAPGLLRRKPSRPTPSTPTSPGPCRTCAMSALRRSTTRPRRPRACSGTRPSAAPRSDPSGSGWARPMWRRG